MPCHPFWVVVQLLSAGLLRLGHALGCPASAAQFLRCWNLQTVARKAAKEGRSSRDELLQALIVDCQARRDEEVVTNLQNLRSQKGERWPSCWTQPCIWWTLPHCRPCQFSRCLA